MKNAVLIHGKSDAEEYYSKQYPSMSNSHWFPWLQKQLLVRDIVAQTPEMPRPYEPDYKLWSREFEQFDITPDTILVGHSCGGGFLIRWLSEHPEVHIGKVVLVAPWINAARYHADVDFFDGLTIDKGLASRTQGLTIFHSDDDHSTIQASVRVLREQLEDIKYREFHKYGHFCKKDLKTEAFPELLQELVGE